MFPEIFAQKAMVKKEHIPKPKPEPKINLSNQGQALLLKTKQEFVLNQSMFQTQPSLSDCAVDEHYQNCLQITLFSDTDFFLAEKWLTDFWKTQGHRISVSNTNPDQTRLIISAYDDSKKIAQITLLGAEIPKPAPLQKNPAPARTSIKTGKVAIVIDDLGDNEQEALKIARIPGPITFSILPFQSRTQQVLEIAKHYQKPIMLHMPMEPVTDANPGPGALLCAMTPEQITIGLAKALDSVPGAIGINNHMGSAFTARKDLMEPLLSEIKRRGLFFLDSRTSGESVGYKLAQEMDVKSCERKIFLDNLQDPESISQRLSELCRIAKENGFAIGIGHPYPETIRTLAEKMDEFERDGCELVPVEELCQ